MALLLFLLLLLPVGAEAGEVGFPTTPPNDPRYAPAMCPGDPDCAGPTGQWNLFSFAPNDPPTPHASGISADLAWMTTIGHPDVVIAVLDSGVNYDHEDLRDKVWLNRGELPAPTGGCCAAPLEDPHDCNADGVFNVVDYACDPAVTDTNGSGALDRGDLRVFADDIDSDLNGYVDDLSGFDTDDDDGDEFDHRYFGHGTGRAGIAAPATDNGVGVAGICPRCPLMSVRIDDTFVASSDGCAKGAIFAVDSGAQVINMALGMLNSSDLLRGAFDYATRKNVLAVNASANEFSFHHNFATVFDDVMAIGGVTANDRAATTSWLQKANFSNFGAHLDVVAPTEVPNAGQGRSGPDPNNARYGNTGSGTSSAVPHAAGAAGLVFSRARELIELGALDVAGLALPDISAQEVRQIIDRTADDVTPLDGTDYPVSAGWDKWTGYGRINAGAAVALVAPTTIPPEADINTPDWYSIVPGGTTVDVSFYANARWASSFDWVIERGEGVEPTTFEELASATGVLADPSRSSADGVSTIVVPLDTAALGDGLHTLRLRVTDDLGNVGEDRMAFWLRASDPDDLPGFPLQLAGSFESLSVAVIDLDGTDGGEIVLMGGNGELHALRSDGSELPGFPVRTDLPRNLPLTYSDAFDGNAANGEVPLSGASTTGGVAVGDLDGDGMLEIVTGTVAGDVYCWHADGAACDGFPVSTDFGFSRDQYAPYGQIENASRGEAVGGPPTLGDLDGDGTLEIIAGSVDQKLYVWNGDGSRFGVFPIALVDPEESGVDEFAPAAVVSSAGVADLDGDGTLEMVVATTETFGPSIGGTGRAYVVRADGTFAPGWPIRPTSLQTSAVPLVAEGIGTSPAITDVDGDGTMEIAIQPFFAAPTLYNADGSVFRTMDVAPFGATGAGGDLDETTPEGGLARATDQPGNFYVGQGAFADLDLDGALDYLAPTLGFGIAGQLGGSGTRVDFDHLLSAWSTDTGAYKAAFPRVMEDWQFQTGPAVADVSGDGSPEAIATSGGYFVHAFDAEGNEPPGWPKRTGHWQTATPTLGDVDGDGLLEVVQPTRLGSVFVWRTAGRADQTGTWSKFQHDARNSGVLPASEVESLPGLNWRYVSGSSVLEWTTPNAAASYEVCASSEPEPCDFSEANLAEFVPGTPARDPGITELREVHEISLLCIHDDDCLTGVCDEDKEVCEDAICESDDDCPVGDCEFGTCVRDVLDTGLYFSVRALDAAGNPRPATTTDGFDVHSVSIKTVGKERDRSRLVVKGRFPVKNKALDLPGPDVRVRLVHGETTLLDVVVPGAEVRRSDGKVRFRDKDGALTRMTFGAGRRSLVTFKTGKLDLIVDCPVSGDEDECELPFATYVEVGDRPFDDTVTLRRKNQRRLVYP